MAKKSKAFAAAEALLDELEGFDKATVDAVLSIVGDMLASLPGGDELADVGYEPMDIDWTQFRLVRDLFNAIDNGDDVRSATEVLLDSVEDEEED